jgi:hypothetical protein
VVPPAGGVVPVLEGEGDVSGRASSVGGTPPSRAPSVVVVVGVECPSVRRGWRVACGMDHPENWGSAAEHPVRAAVTHHVRVRTTTQRDLAPTGSACHARGPGPALARSGRLRRRRSARPVLVRLLRHDRDRPPV